MGPVFAHMKQAPIAMDHLDSPLAPIQRPQRLRNSHAPVAAKVASQTDIQRAHVVPLSLVEGVQDLGAYVLELQAHEGEGEEPLLHVLKVAGAVGFGAEMFGRVWEIAEVEEEGWGRGERPIAVAKSADVQQRTGRLVDSHSHCSGVVNSRQTNPY